jgi:16S rRNA (guanine527-N7)-methyltransferase
VASIAGLISAFDPTPEDGARLQTYAGLLEGYERANVTGARRSPQAIAALIGDSLALVDALPATAADDAAAPGRRWLDLGTGGGIPGIPLTLLLHEVEMTLVDSIARKCAFVSEALTACGLTGRARVVCARSERLAAAGAPDREAYDVVLAKAVDSLSTVVELAAPLLRVGGLLLAHKSDAAAEAEWAGGEVAGAACGLAPRRVVPLPRSPLARSVCVVCEKTAPTSERFPRREGVARKRPLG